MKNYVIHFANAQLDELQKSAKNNPVVSEKMLKITRAVYMCDFGKISEFDAIAQIVDAVRGA